MAAASRLRTLLLPCCPWHQPSVSRHLLRRLNHLRVVLLRTTTITRRSSYFTEACQLPRQEGSREAVPRIRDTHHATKIQLMVNRITNKSKSLLFPNLIKRQLLKINNSTIRIKKVTVLWKRNQFSLRQRLNRWWALISDLWWWRGPVGNRLGRWLVTRQDLQLLIVSSNRPSNTT